MSTGTPAGHAEQGSAVVIEDDIDIRNIVVAVLRQAGFDVHSEATGRNGVEVVRRMTPTVVTLDVGLPDIDGYEVLRRIRNISDCYVIMLSARADELDTLTALQAGADDYLIKPFRPRELRARIDAMLRRPRLEATRPPAPPVPASAPPPTLLPATATAAAVDLRNPAVLRHGELVLDREARTAKLADEELLLTRSEFDLLHDLLRSNGAVRTRSALVGVVRGEEYRGYSYVSDADQRAIEVHIGNLRRKLTNSDRSHDVITTVRGIGYRLIPLPGQQPAR
ncbi:response regulator transcription factor [Arthrobacter sp. H41]|uniref:response regulator transcription factor n=1 Tax=Arthrobacter sp. H41 TaxID=1312978 RepID=UPI0004B00E57|nr:response regulator transcription factor [Arthrobacter sp. H41]